MGSRLSILLRSPPISGPPLLPFDIFWEILSHLHISLAEDRKIILALALCCRALREASQRVLFSRMHYGYLEVTPDHLVRNIKVHSKFLRAIINSPNRLALFVCSYSQHRLALDPKFRSAGTPLYTSRLAHRFKWLMSSSKGTFFGSHHSPYLRLDSNRTSAPSNGQSQASKI